MKTFDTCTLPEVYFYSNGKDPWHSKQIQNDDDCLFINTTVEKRDDQEWTTTAQEYKQITQEIKALEKRQKQLRDALISMSDHVNSIGGGVQVLQCVRRGVVEFSRIEALEGIDLDMYRGDLIKYWKVTEI